MEHLSYWHPAPLLAAVVARWIANGDASIISQAIERECLAREQAARRAISRFGLITQPGSMHVWLNLPDPWCGETFAAEAERRGVLLRPARLFAVDDQPMPNAVRLSLSTPARLEDVQHGLNVLREMLEHKT
jgi:DNA-binding transcriptional MocR family regulator